MKYSRSKRCLLLPFDCGIRTPEKQASSLCNRLCSWLPLLSLPRKAVEKLRMVSMVSLNGPVMPVPSPRPYLRKPTDFTPLLLKLGLDWSSPIHSSACNAKAQWGKGRTASSSTKARALGGNNDLVPSRQCIVLDIEGTTTPISFVFDVLFPYARDNVGNHLTATYDTEETQDDIRLLRAQIQDDLEQGIAGAVPIPPEDTGKEEIIGPLVANVEAMIRADRKITALKQLQGHIWRTGFQNNELKGEVFEDVPKALQKWHAMGIKVYIYSSGSREAQRLIFGNTIYGDLRKYLCGFFDTMIGNKRETRSYLEIFQSVGVDKPSQILFVTDVYQEAIAAKAAGLEVLISIRPGNAPVPENHGFGTIKSLLEI